MNENEQFNSDPTQEDTFDVGQETPRFDGADSYVESELEPADNAPQDKVMNISERLSQTASSSEKETSSEPRAEAPMAIDITKLSTQQIQALQQMLKATPEAHSAEERKTTIQIPVIDGMILREFGRAYKKYVKNEETGMNTLKDFIKYKVFGSEEEYEVEYKIFSHLDKEKFEVIDNRSKVKTFIEGKVFSRERGVMVDAVRRSEETEYLIALPDGTQHWIPSYLVNA